MACNYGMSEAQFQLIKVQAARRAEMRREFLKQSSNPHKHAAQAGYVFDDQIQRYLSMKVTQFEHFKANKRTSVFGFLAIVVPFFTYGYIVKTNRDELEKKYRSGEIRYRERIFKFA